MDDTALVGGTQAFRDRYGEGEKPRELKTGDRDQLTERPSLHQFHRDEVASLGLLHRMNGDDVGVAQRGDSPGLVFEAFHALRPIRLLLGKHLEGDASAQEGILRQIHLAHASFAQFLDDAIVTDFWSDH